MIGPAIAPSPGSPPPVTYSVPLELVKLHASATGLAFLLRAEMRGAMFKPVATMEIRAERFIAEVWFEAPIGPERQTSVVVMLGVMPEGRAA